MTPRANRLAFLLACGTALGLGVEPALASSELIQGEFIEADPAGPSYHGAGVCSFITGPRDGLAAGQFVLTVGDQDPAHSGTLRLNGGYTATTTRGGQVFTLRPDPRAAARYIQDVLRKQLADNGATFRLDTLDATAQVIPPGRLLCGVNLTGQLTSDVAPVTEVTVSFARQGIFEPGYAAPVPTKKIAPAPVAATAAADPCPTTDPQNLNGSLAPLGLAPVPAQCDTAQCLVSFKGYKWWTSFQYYGAAGGFFPNGGYFYNGGLRTAFAPKNAYVDGSGNLHMLIAKRDLGGGPTVAGAEVALMFNADSSEANLGYGDYLVTATVKSAASWGQLDPNAAFGVFTFERVGTGDTGPATNPHREIDLAELSRWGWNHAGQCPFKGNTQALCEGNAQFTLQPWESKPQNLHRYTIGSGANTLTLVMKWHGANQPVTFDEYDGAFNFGNLPATASNTWTTSDVQNQFVPATKCERFHLNFWMGNFTAGKEPNPPPSTLPQEVVVTDFQFRPAP